MNSLGPGLSKEIVATTSLKFLGLITLNARFAACVSNWNIPVVLTLEKIE